MAAQFDRLTRIGREAFAILDACYDNGKSPTSRPAGKLAPIHHQEHQNHPHHHNHHHQYDQHQPPLVYHGPQISTVWIPALVTTHDVVQYYGTASAGIVKEMTCEEAAKYCGGIAVGEPGRRKQFPST